MQINNHGTESGTHQRFHPYKKSQPPKREGNRMSIFRSENFSLATRPYETPANSNAESFCHTLPTPVCQRRTDLSQTSRWPELSEQTVFLQVGSRTEDEDIPIDKGCLTAQLVWNCRRKVNLAATFASDTKVKL